MMSSPESAQTQQDSVYALARSADGLYAARTSGLYRSQDGGETWQNVFASLNLDQSISATAVAAAGNTVFTGTYGAILHSDDSGETWQIAALSSPPPHVAALAISPNFAEDGTAAAGTMEDGVFISTDRGETWIPWNFGLVDLNVYAICFSPDFAKDQTLFAGTESGIFRSHNGGRSWREMPFPMDAAPVISLSASPDYAEDGVLYAGTEGHGLNVSSDHGATWQQINAVGTSVVVHAIHLELALRLHIWALLEERLMYSADSGQSWHQYGGDFPFTRMAMAMVPDIANAASMLVGFEDGDILPLLPG